MYNSLMQPSPSIAKLEVYALSLRGLAGRSLTYPGRTTRSVNGWRCCEGGQAKVVQICNQASQSSLPASVEIAIS
eukprot:6174378-Pleurochrysis_carterae.AAC.3